MTRTLSAAVKSVFAPTIALRDCPPDCRYEYMCDANGRYYRRQCCFRPDCVYVCESWTLIGSC
ncbi:hypothetical protein [Jiangella asiatica]|uniref:Uncharacterized protein n=1 Tax=Jiangella asiatica TaxID=2530372 RepID=A0A4V6PFE8_9ACTN|nr:hypothetical protein [Jiangella asiatica]TDE01808.1 hypothetical protein E1269_22630 [Jiangella asiatica]